MDEKTFIKHKHYIYCILLTYSKVAVVSNIFLLLLRVSQYSKLCNQFMEEKNNYVRLKQIASQTSSELTEQLNILENKMKIQRSIADSKDRCVHVFESIRSFTVLL